MSPNYSESGREGKEATIFLRGALAEVIQVVLRSLAWFPHMSSRRAALNPVQPSQWYQRGPLFFGALG